MKATIKEKITAKTIAFIAACLLAVCAVAVPVETHAISSFSGDTVLIEGDSLQTKDFGKYLQRAAKKLKAKKIDNKAQNGATIAKRNDSSNSVYTRIMAMTDKDIQQYDYIFIAAGTNDFGNYKNHGRASLGSVSNKNPKTTCGALNRILDRIDKVSPETKVVIVPPTYRYHGWKKNNYTKKFKKDCDKITNKYGYTLKDYRIRITRTANSHNNACALDVTKIAKKSEMRSKKKTRDYCHPKTGFAKVMGTRAAKQINKI